MTRWLLGSLALAAVAGAATPAEASHFRGGNIFVEVTPAGAVTVTIDSLWRKTAFVSLGAINVRNDSNTTITNVNTPVNVWENTSDDSFSIRRQRWSFNMATGAGLANGAPLSPNTWYRIYVTSCCRIGGIANAPESTWALTARFRWDPTRTTQTPLLDANISTTVFKTTNGSVGPAWTQNLGAIDPDQPLQYTFLTGAVSPDYGATYHIGDIGTQGFSSTANTCIVSGYPETCTVSPSPFTSPAQRISVDQTGQLTIPGNTIVNMKDLTYYEITSPRGDYVFKLRVTDSTGAFSERDILLDVSKTSNNPPNELVFTGPRTVEIGQQISIDVSASDADAAQLVTLIGSNIPSWMTFTQTPGNPGRGTLSGTPTLTSHVGSYSINVDARDNGSPQLTTSGSINITVTGVNDTPSITFVPNQAVATDPLSGALLLNSGTTLSLTVSATDPNPNDTLTLSAFFGTEGNMPAGASFVQTGPNTGVFTWVLTGNAHEGVWSPTNTAIGRPPLSIRVRDNGTPQLSATQNITISIGPSANVSPHIRLLQQGTQNDIIQPVIRLEGDPIVFDLVAYDDNPADRLVIDYANTTPLPPGATLTNVTTAGAYPNPVRYTFSWTPSAGQAGNYSIQFFTLDNGAPPIDERRTVDFRISAPATPPNIISLSPNQGPSEGGTVVTVNGTGFTGATSVVFGPGAVAFTVLGDSMLTFVTGPGTAGALANVSVSTPYGTDTRVDAFQYRANPDTDGDGIPDCFEGSTDSDQDGVPDQSDTDSDGDGITDNAEGPGSPVIPFTCGGVGFTVADTDGDGTPDFRDLDSDADGRSDFLEGQADLDGDGVANYRDTDADGDSIHDAADNCPTASNATQTDTDGDGVGNACDNDTDNDGLSNAQEAVAGTNPNDADSDDDGLSDGDEVLMYFTNPLDTDSDNGGISDGLEVQSGTNPNNPADDDRCPTDATKTVPGICGCGIPDTDTDGDGTPDCNDACPIDATNDVDGDGLCASSDNCPSSSNASQSDADGDGMGDVCDGDDDNDGVSDAVDNCALDSNSDQANADGDAAGDICDSDDDNDGVADGSDNCPLTFNPDQLDSDAHHGDHSIPHDHLGDACDPDDDNDGVADGMDNCQFEENADQADLDSDGVG
ncbi:thrombospondin type 3 repeat-containing protein, partial [Myxococcota bacterium]|nr:thrombospondin type 3 repeat-containing protein [Myxococcota bacterium]